MEAVNGVSEGDKGGPPPPSPLTGCYLLIVIGEPHCNEHKDIILQRVAKGLLSWDVNEYLVDLEKELAIITEQALEGEEARYGERLIQFASENLVTEILIHPVVSTLAQCVRNLLSSFTRHRHIIHAGYTFANNGSWILQDGTFSSTDFSEAFQELEVLRVIRAYENGISIDVHCAPEGDWTRLPKESFTKGCKIRVNPNDVLTSGSPSISSFINYLEPFLVPAELENVLESSDVVGNIRFSRPTLYVFPGGQGDAALFGINGFNMLLDGGFSRKACFWDFVRHLDRLDAVLLTRLNNSNVNGISSVLKRKRQNALYPQIGHFFCNIQERKAILSPDGDKDKDPLLINLLEEGQEIVSNLRHLSLIPQVCYRDSEPINLYHKVGHGTLDMYVLSPAKDSKEVREFLQKWNNNDQKLFANPKINKDFVFPLQNLVSICALLVWQPANPEDTITRILFPGSSPQNKIFEGLDKIKSLDCIKHPVCSEKSLAPTHFKTKHSVIDRILPEKKIPLDNKKEKPQKPTAEIIETDIKNGEVNGVQPTEKTAPVKKSDSTESEKSISKSKKIVENGDKTEKPKPKPKVEAKPKPRSESQQRKFKSSDKKPLPTTPKKQVDKNVDESPKPKPKPSPSATPAKSTKEANNRKVVESKIKAAPKKETKEPPKPASEKKEVKVERKPISRRPKDTSKITGSPSKKVNGIQKPDSISRRGKLDKEGTTDSSTVSTPSADQDSILKKDISKLTSDEIQNLKAQELADLKEEQEAVKEIEAVFRKGELQEDKPSDFRKIKDLSIDDKLESEEYLIIEKTEIEQDLVNESNKEEETQKIARDSEESEKQRKLSGEKEQVIEEKRTEIQDEVQKVIVTATDVVKAKEEVVEASKEVSVTSPEEKIDISTDKKEEEVKEIAQESQPDEKGSANIESGATTTAPTLPEDERMPLDEIKEDNGDQIIEEKHIKEDTKEKDVPVIQLPPKTVENIAKLPPVVGIRLDKQSHIRDIVKTPDEVADLPVHEEVEFDHYEEYPNVTETKLEVDEIKKEDIQKTDAKETEKKVEVDVEAKDKTVENISGVEEVKEKTDVDFKNEESEIKKDEKIEEAVISEDLNKKELSKSPDEEKDKDEHEEKLEFKDIKLPSEVQAIKDEKEIKIEEKKSKAEEKEIQKEEKAVEIKDTSVEKSKDKVEEIDSKPLEETKDKQKLLEQEKIVSEIKKEVLELDKKEVAENLQKIKDSAILEHQKSEEVIEKSETEVKEKDVKEGKGEERKEKEKLDDLKQELPSVPTHEVIPDKEPEKPKPKDEEKLKEDVNKIQQIDEKLKKLKDESLDLSQPEVKKSADDLNEEKKEETKLKEDVTTIEKIDERLQKLKDVTETVSEVVTHKVEEPQHAEPVIITTDSLPESPIIDEKMITDKMELGRKSPKEREEDVTKIVATVAEVLKSDAPLEEFEGKIPFNIPYKSYTTELRETHITTQESPVTDENKSVAKQEETFCPKASSTYFIEEERKIAPIHEEPEIQESKISKMIKDSNELMQTTSKIIQDIKQTQQEDTTKDDQDAGTVHRMLVTASSEDGGEEIEICPAGTITFSRSSESSGRSSPEAQSQKASQKSSVADTVSDAATVIAAKDKELKDVEKKEPESVKDSNKVEEGKVSEKVELKEVEKTDKQEKDEKLEKVEEKSVTAHKEKSILEITKEEKKDSKVEEEKKDSKVEEEKKDSKAEEEKKDSKVGEEKKEVEETIVKETGIPTEAVKEVESELKYLADTKEEIKETVKKEAETDLEATKETLEKVKENVEIKVEQVAKEVEEKKSFLGGLVNDIGESLVEDTTKLIEDAHKKVEDLKETAKDKVEELKQNVTTKKDELEKAVENVKESISKETAAVKNATKEIKDTTEIKVEEIKETIAKEKESLLESTKELEKSVSEKAEAITEAVKSEVTKEKEVVEEKLKDLKETISKQEETAIGVISDIKETLTKDAEHKIDEIKKEVEDVETKVGDITGKIDEKVSSLEKETVDVSKEAKVFVDDSKKVLEEAKDKAVSEIKDIESKVGRILDEVKSKEENLIKGIKDEAKNVEDKFNESKHQATEKLDQLNKELTTDSKKEVDDLEKKYDLYNGLESVEKMVVDVLTADREEPHTKKDSDKKSVAGILERVESEVEEIVDKGVAEVKEFVEDTKEAITSLFKHQSSKEELLEKSAQDIQQNYDIVSDMTKSVVFEKCEQESPEHEKLEKQLEKSVESLEKDYVAVSEITKSVVFEKCEKPLDEEQKEEKVIEKSAKDIEENYEILSDMAKAVSFEKCDKPLTEQQKEEKVLEKSAKDIEENYKVLSDMAKSISFEKCEKLTEEQKEEKVLEKVAKDIEENYKVVADMAQSTVFEKCEKPLTQQQKEEKFLEESAKNVEEDFKVVSDMSQSIVFDKCHLEDHKEEKTSDAKKAGEKIETIVTKLDEKVSSSEDKKVKEKDSAATSGKSSPEKLEEKESQISSPALSSNVKDLAKEASGKSTPDIKETDYMKVDNQDSLLSGKSSPGLSGKSSPLLSGRSSPGEKLESKDSLLSGKSTPEQSKPEVSHSGKSSPALSNELKEEKEKNEMLKTEIKSDASSVKSSPVGSGKASPVLTQKAEDSGKSTPVPSEKINTSKDKIVDEIIDKKEQMQSDSSKTQKDLITSETAQEKNKTKGKESEIFSNDLEKKTESDAQSDVSKLEIKDSDVKKLSVSDIEISGISDSMKPTESDPSILPKSDSPEETKQSDDKTETKDVDSIDSGIGTDVDSKAKKIEEAEKITQQKNKIEAGPSIPAQEESLTLAKTSTEQLHLSGKSTPDIAEVEKMKELNENVKQEKHILEASTPPTVPVSPIVKDISSTQSEDAKTTSSTPIKSSTITSVKESEIRSYTPGSDDLEIGASTHSDISSGQVSRAPPLESERIESDDDEEVPGSPMSVTSQVAHSRSSSRYDFDDDRIGTKLDPMNTSFYGALPDEEDTELDFDKALQEHRQTRGEDLVTSYEESPSYLYEVTKAKYTSRTPEPETLSGQTQLDQINKNEASNVMTASFIGDLPSSSDKTKDVLESWGKPLGLPSPAPPNDNRGTPKKEKKLPSNVSAKNKLNDDKKRAESPSKYRNKKINPIYVDLTYVPHHGNANYSYIDFFKRVRARYYVFSGIEPSREVYNALLEAKQTWDDKELEVTIIPTYDTDILGYWVAENEELLTKYKIDLSPSASRCTINLQDHETSCSAYRLEF